MSLPPIEEHFLCPITIDVMTDPVSIKCKERHSFDRDAISEWFKTSDRCPVCKQKVSSKKLIPNRLLKQIIESWKREQNSTPASLAGRAEPPRVLPPKQPKKEVVRPLSAQRAAPNSRSWGRDDSSRVSFHSRVPEPPQPAVVSNYLYSGCSVSVYPVYTPAVHIFFSCHGSSPQPNPYHDALEQMNRTLSRLETQVRRIEGAVDRFVREDAGRADYG